MRFKKLTILLFLAGLMGLNAQTSNAPQNEPKVIPVQDSIYMIQHRGGNIGISVGSDGVFMIDDQFADNTPAILNAILTVTDQQVQFLVNTHHHGDHTGGNKNMTGQGTVIFSHQNVRRKLVAIARKEKFGDMEEKMNDAMDKIPEGSKEEAYKEAKEKMSSAVKQAEEYEPDQETLPMVTFSDNLSFYYNGEEIAIFHVANAHTDGDVMVYFTNSNVIHSGDAFVNGRYPYIDKENGGTLEGYIKGLDRLLMIADKETRIIPGHGGVARRVDVSYTRGMLVFLRDRVAFHHVSGKSKEEILAMTELTKEYDDKGFGDGFINKDRFMEMIYIEATKRYPKTVKDKK